MRGSLASECVVEWGVYERVLGTGGGGEGGVQLYLVTSYQLHIPLPKARTSQHERLPKRLNNFLLPTSETPILSKKLIATLIDILNPKP